MSNDEAAQKPAEGQNRSGVSEAIQRLGQSLKPHQQGEVQSLSPDRLGGLSPPASPESARPEATDTQERLKALSKPSAAPRISSEPQETLQRGQRPCP